MKIANSGYSPINKSNTNYQNTQQNPVFQGAILGKLVNNHLAPDFEELIDHLTMNMAIKGKNLKKGSVMEPTITQNGIGKDAKVLFGEDLDSFAKKWVERYENAPESEKIEGLSFKFDPTQSSDSMPEERPVRQHPLVRLLHWAFS